MRKRWIALVLIFALLMGMTACTGGNSETEPTESTTQEPETTSLPTTTQAPEPTAHELFAEAVEPLKGASNISMGFEAREEHKVWEDLFVQTISGTAVFEGLDSELVGQVDAMVHYNGNDAIAYTELFVDGSTYATYGEKKYRDEAGQEAFFERQYPPCLFDPENFASGEVEKSDQGTVLKFSDATAMETWVAADYAVLQEATGEVVLSTKGISSMRYTVTYRQGSADIVLEVSTTPSVEAEASLGTEPPTDGDSYVLLSYCWAPRIMDRAIRNWNASESSSASISELLINQAAGVLYYGRSISYEHSADRPLMKERVFTQVMLPDGTEEMETESIYRSGVLTVKQDGKTQVVKSGDRTIEQYVSEIFQEDMMDVSWIETCEVSAMGELFFFEFTSQNAECLEHFKSDTTAAFFGDSDPLASIASKYEEKGFSGYMGVDPDTWLPTSYGFDYKGLYTVEGQECEHSQSYNAQLVGSDPMAYHTITDKYPEEEKPPVEATPLLYRVTGADGSEMWLFGTIHVGDERTAFLPQEIYDAFEASDALAVEFNLNEDDKNMEEDEEYADSITELYYYTDDSQTKDHLEEEVYEAAVKMLKCLGQYNSNMDYMKPFVWESSITGALRQNGRRLFSEKGMDRRLLDLAEKAGKEILDVESAEEQTQMLSNFSDGLQEQLLKEALTYERSSYNEGLLELFEMWCAGDEETLRKYINDEEEETEEDTEEDTEGDTEEETTEVDEELEALRQEYENAMSTERDINMIEIAKGYLTSGKTVFYAVGLAHLLADDGLVDGLRAAGYTVELVEYKK